MQLLAQASKIYMQGINTRENSSKVNIEEKDIQVKSEA